MAAIALRTSGDISLDVVESNIQDTQSAGVAVVPGDVVGYDASGNWTTSGVLGTTEAAYKLAYGVITRKAAVGESVTAVRKGVIDGLNLDALAYNASVFLADAGGMADTAGTFATGRVGRVIPGRANSRGVARDKLLFVDL